MTASEEQRAAAACDTMYAYLGADWGEGGELVLGPELARSPIPEVQRLHERGAHFFWVAASLRGASFWELHAGAVIDTATMHVRAGIHRASASAIGMRLFTLLAPELLARGFSNVEAPLADEVQLVGAARDFSLPSSLVAACDEVRALVRQAQPLLREIVQ